MNVAAAFLAAASTWRDNIAVVSPGGPATDYGRLSHNAAALAGALRARGLSSSDRVALAASNTPAYFEILLGVWIAGLCAVPLNPRLHSREFAYAIDNSGAKVCFASQDLSSSLPGEGCEIVEIGSLRYQEMLDHAPTAPIGRAPEDLAWLFYTSGTTGKPKGAMLTHRNLMAFIASMLADSGSAIADHALHISPLSHGSGFIGLCYLMRGRTNVVLPPGALDRAALTSAFDLATPLSFFAVPTVVAKLMDGIMATDMTEHVHMIYFGGAPMYVDDLKRAIRFFGSERLWHLYGQGEAPMTITYLPPWLRGAPGSEDYEGRLASVGIARTGVAIRVLDEAGADCPAGCAGEVAVAGDVVMGGYWNDPAATAAAFRDGWLLTGDLGVLDAEGFLTLHDRSKDMIISGGSNIYPREIEEVLLTFPGIRECAVVGIRDAKWGEAPVAFVVASEDDGPEVSALDAHCLAHLARFKRPRRYLLVSELPKNGYGKVMKTALRDIAERG